MTKPFTSSDDWSSSICPIISAGSAAINNTPNIAPNALPEIISIAPATRVAGSIDKSCNHNSKLELLVFSSFICHSTCVSSIMPEGGGS